MAQGDNTIDARVAESFAAQGMMETLGARLLAASDGTCAITAPIRGETGQQQGFAHAGLTFAIGDSAQGYAALSLLEDGMEVVTSEMKINLLAPAKGDVLLAEGRVLRNGRRLIVTEADIWADDGGTRRQVAKMLGTIVPVSLQPRDRP